MILLLFPKKYRRMKRLPKNARAKVDVYPEVSVNLIPQVASVEAEGNSSGRLALEKRKREAAEPLYINRF